MPFQAATAIPRRAVTPAAFVRGVVAAYERYGRDPTEALSRGQVTPDLVNSPDGRVTAGQFDGRAGQVRRPAAQRLQQRMGKDLPILIAASGDYKRLREGYGVFDYSLRKPIQVHRLARYLARAMVFADGCDGQGLATPH